LLLELFVEELVEKFVLPNLYLEFVEKFEQQLPMHLDFVVQSK
jgi:hypothetical protein